jgi:hypothetical protein
VGAGPIKVAFLTQPATLPVVVPAIALVAVMAQAIAAAIRPTSSTGALYLELTIFPAE